MNHRVRSPWSASPLSSAVALRRRPVAVLLLASVTVGACSLAPDRDTEGDLGGDETTATTEDDAEGGGAEAWDAADDGHADVGTDLGELDDASTDGTTTSSDADDDDDADGPPPLLDAGDDDAGDADSDTDPDASDDTADDGDDGDGDGDDSTPCVDTHIVLETPQPRVLLVLDKSGSMGLMFSPTLTRWAALHQVVSTIVGELESSVAFGLTLYPSDGACAVEEVQVGVGIGQAGAILAAMPAANAVVNGATPAGSGLEAAYAHLATLGGGDPRAVIFVADGDTTPACEGPNSADQVLSLVEASHTEGIATWVVGIAPTSATSTFLAAIAAAGGTAVSQAPGFYQADDANALATKFSEVMQALIPCTLELPEPVADAQSLTVLIDGVAQPLVETCTTVVGVRPIGQPITAIELCEQSCAQARDWGAVGVHIACTAG